MNVAAIMNKMKILLPRNVSLILLDVLSLSLLEIERVMNH